MMQETMEKRANRTVGKSRQKDFFAVLLFFFLLPYTCSSVVRAGQENGGNHCARIRQDSPDAKWKRRPNDDRGSVSDRRAGGGDSCRI